MIRFTWIQFRTAGRGARRLWQSPPHLALAITRRPHLDAPVAGSQQHRNCQACPASSPRRQPRQVLGPAAHRRPWPSSACSGARRWSPANSRPHLPAGVDPKRHPHPLAGRAARHRLAWPRMPPPSCSASCSTGGPAPSTMRRAVYPVHVWHQQQLHLTSRCSTRVRVRRLGVAAGLFDPPHPARDGRHPRRLHRRHDSLPLVPHLIPPAHPPPPSACHPPSTGEPSTATWVLPTPPASAAPGSSPAMSTPRMPRPLHRTSPLLRHHSVGPGMRCLHPELPLPADGDLPASQPLPGTTSGSRPRSTSPSPSSSPPSASAKSASLLKPHPPPQAILPPRSNPRTLRSQKPQPSTATQPTSKQTTAHPTRRRAS